MKIEKHKHRIKFDTEKLDKALRKALKITGKKVLEESKKAAPVLTNFYDEEAILQESYNTGEWIRDIFEKAKEEAKKDIICHINKELR